MKRDLVFMAHPVEPDSTVLGEWLGWDGLTRVTGLQSMILKLAVFMINENLRWGVLATERQCRVFRVQYARVPPEDGELYPYLLMSDPVPVDSSNPSILSVLMYMVLTGTALIRPPANLGPEDEEQGDEGGIDLVLDALIGQPSTMRMTRADLNPAHPAWGHRTIQVQSVLGSGLTGVCLRGVMGPTAVVIKFAQMGQRDALEHEAEVYEHVLSNMASSSSDLSPAPRYFGSFEDRDGRRALVLEDVGPALQSFDELTVKAKTDLLSKLRRLHGAGIVHNDLAPRNVTCGAQGVKIIDYAHSSTHLGEGSKPACEEIKRLAVHKPERSLTRA
ncbi:MAG: hypothetical protein M1826_003599 [Phylliscum demangeonii]|nr:MAG: hypothetical protein M1826_003599 [Phylliscum demangeonii]